MNTTTTPVVGNPGGGGHKMSGFGYGVGVSVGLLLLITTITLASYFCTRPNTTGITQLRRRPPQEDMDIINIDIIDIELGLDEATLRSYPKVMYSKDEVADKANSTALCCSICIGDYKDSEMLRLLPECGHMFHLKCVDPWLRRNPTCPLCRTSPMPSPMPTPLAEVVPIREHL